MTVKPQKGYALATILILLGVCMFGAAALVTISILDSKISRSQTEGTVAYYAAEAGVSDAIWRLNNTAAYKTGMIAGNLNTTYTVVDKPAVGQGFVVTLTTPAQGAGYALVDVVGTSNNGTFVASRHEQATVFIGDSSPSFGSNAFFSGGAAAITDGTGSVNITGGDVFVRGGLTVTNTTLNAVGQNVNATGNFVNSSSTINDVATHALNLPPAPSDIAVPGYNFAQYAALPTTKCTAALYAAQAQLRCTPAQLQTLIGGSNNFTFPNSVVYVDAAETMNNWVHNKTFNFTGYLVINGDLTVSAQATGFHLNINDPGNGQSGLLVKGNINNSNGTWAINGIFYASGTISFTSSQTVTIDGAMVSGGATTINTGLNLSINYNGYYAAAVLGGTQPTAVQVQHWEEEY